MPLHLLGICRQWRYRDAARRLARRAAHGRATPAGRNDRRATLQRDPLGGGRAFGGGHRAALACSLRTTRTRRSAWLPSTRISAFFPCGTGPCCRMRKRSGTSSATVAKNLLRDLVRVEGTGEIGLRIDLAEPAAAPSFPQRERLSPYRPFHLASTLPCGGNAMRGRIDWTVRPSWPPRASCRQCTDSIASGAR